MLEKEIADICEMRNKKVELLQELIADTQQWCQRKIREAIVKAGRTPCEACEMFGANERLDSRVMKSFGLREWEGCEECGGEYDKRGRGWN